MAKEKKVKEPKVKIAREDKKTNKKNSEYFQVNGDKVFDIVERLEKKKDIEVYMITCFEIKVKWLEKTYKREDIIKMLK